MVRSYDPLMRRHWDGAYAVVVKKKWQSNWAFWLAPMKGFCWIGDTLHRWYVPSESINQSTMPANGDLGKTVSLPPKMLVPDLRGECERAGDRLELALVIGISSVVETKPWNVDQHLVLSFSTLITVWVLGALMKAQVNLGWTRSWRRQRTRRSWVWSVRTLFLLQDRQAPATFGALLATDQFLSKAHCHPQEPFTSLLPVPL